VKGLIEAIQGIDCGTQKCFNYLVEEFRGYAIKYAFTGIGTDESTVFSFLKTKRAILKSMCFS
jgi:hypothetical protein